MSRVKGRAPIKFRKKPVAVEAMRFESMDDYFAIASWFRKVNTGTLSAEETFQFRHPLMLVTTLEGTMVANPGDWIIRGVQGEFYPCKSDIFEATYERVDDDERTDSVSEVRGDEAS